MLRVAFVKDLLGEALAEPEFVKTPLEAPLACPCKDL